MEKIQTLTLRSIIDAARKACHEGRLGAHYGFQVCRFSYEVADKRRVGCAIGVALSDAVIDVLDRRVTVPTVAGDHTGLLNDCGFDALLSHGPVSFDGTEFQLLCAKTLQAMHDDWSIGVKYIHTGSFGHISKNKEFMAAMQPFIGREFGQESFLAYLDYIEQYA